MNRIGIFGAGAWGTALAIVATRAGREAVLWGRTVCSGSMITPGPAVATAAAPTIAARCDAALLVVPAQAVREGAGLLEPLLAGDVPVVVCAKGIERDTLMSMSEVVAEALPGRPAAALSGPNFAAEVARGLPGAAPLACRDGQIARALAEALRSTSFRPYHSTDIAGVELGGAVKNVLAIACGITQGRGLGENARAALLTRGLAEMTRLAVTRGGRVETMMGLAGLGDLTLSCASVTSRNYAAGVAIGRGGEVPNGVVIEGVPTAAGLANLAKRHGIELPICDSVNAILNQAADIDAVIAGLLARPLRAEW